jgi:hypothetical protein
MNITQTTATAAALAFAQGAFAQNIIFVDDDARSGGDGLTWNSAFNDLEDGLAAVKNPGDQVWVAAGIYTPTATGDETSSFIIPNGVALYGGFKGNETNLAGRGDPADNPSILDGNIAPDDAGDIDHLITIDNVSNVIVDGFTLVDAYADGAVQAGGGVLVVDSSATLRNLDIQRCFAFPPSTFSRGGGIAVLGGSSVSLSDSNIEQCSAWTGGGLYAESPMIITDVEFDTNTANSSGGAIRFAGGGVSEIVDCLFLFNDTLNGSGGAIRCDFTDTFSTAALLISESRFVGNIARSSSSGGAISFTGIGEHEIQRSGFYANVSNQFGGAIDHDGNQSSQLLVENSFFSANEAGKRGGAIHQRSPNTLRVIGSTLTRNLSGSNVSFSGDGLGAGIFTAAGDCFITNSILWENDNLDSPGLPRQDQFSFSGSAGGVPRDFSLNYCIVQNWGSSPTNGMQTTGQDPLLVDPDGNDDVAGNLDDNPTLSPFSPAIDAGFSLAVTPIGFFGDFFGGTRFADDPGTPDTGVPESTLPVVDIGAVEFDGVSIACPGDADGDNSVGTSDLLVLLGNWGMTVSGGAADGDFDFDNSVGTSDLLVLLGNWGTTCR